MMEPAHHANAECVDSRFARHKSARAFDQMKGLKPEVDDCYQAYFEGTITEGKLKRVLLKFADAQTQYTQAFKDVVNCMAEEGVEVADPADAVPEYPDSPPPSYTEYPADWQMEGMGVRQRRPVNSDGPSQQSDAQPPTSHTAGAPGGDDNNGDGSRPPTPHRGQDQGLCPGCLRDSLENLQEETGGFLDLVERFFRGLWEVICRIGRALRDFALMVLRFITSMCSSPQAPQAQALNTWAVNTGSQYSLQSCSSYTPLLSSC